MSAAPPPGDRPGTSPPTDLSPPPPPGTPWGACGPPFRRRGRAGRRQPPPWWPEGEPFPPPQAKGPGRWILHKLGCLFVGFLGLIVVSTVLGLLFSGPRHGGPPFGGPLWLLLVGGGIWWVWRRVRRTAAPIGDVMDAANRVAAGDYGARVSAPGENGEIGRLVTSFNAMAERLQANEAQRRNLLADVAHELRTPLSVVRGTVEGMLDGVYARDDERLALVLEETELMARLLDDLRLLSLADGGVLALHREPTDLADLAGDVVAAHRPRAEAAGVALGLRAEPGQPPAEVDPLRVRQVLENLLVNALNHTGRGGAVRVDVAQRDGTATLAVRDTGSGIPPDDLAHVFDRFWKSADSGGSGLGLAIARSLAEAHGGTIRAESVVGRGTVMTLELPLPAGRTVHV